MLVVLEEQVVYLEVVQRVVLMALEVALMVVVVDKVHLEVLALPVAQILHLIKQVMPTMERTTHKIKVVINLPLHFSK